MIRRPIADRVASLLTWSGIAILTATLALWISSEVDRAAIHRQIEDREIRSRGVATVAAFERAMQSVEATLTVTSQTPEPIATSTVVAPAATGDPTVIPTRISTPIPSAVPTRRPAITEIHRIVLRSIDLDAPVILSRLRKGEWDVPKFVAGHLESTALPLQGGNVVLSGHVQSLTSGNVFARLDEAKLGDEIVLRTDGGDIAYRVTGRHIVPNNDISVTVSSGREEVTLITCTGSFNVLTGDYSHRLVIWGERAA